MGIQDGRWKEENEVIPFQLRGRCRRRAKKKKKKRKRKRREEMSVRGRAPRSRSRRRQLDFWSCPCRWACERLKGSLGNVS
jgi:hypothetical protein